MMIMKQLHHRRFFILGGEKNAKLVTFTYIFNLYLNKFCPWSGPLWSNRLFPVSLDSVFTESSALLQFSFPRILCFILVISH